MARGEPGGGEPVRARDIGLRFGAMPTGRWNAITDVAGVQVGHVTLWSGGGPSAIRTGVTAILPHPGNVFTAKVTAATHSINGWGKPTGFAQVAEIGEIETPIVLTTTLSVGAAFTGVVRHALAANPGIGGADGTVNPVVAECNDGWLNASRLLPVTAEHVLEAIAGARDGPVAEGTVGAGTGMTCYGWKGGIGSASRSVETPAGTYTLGVLALTNFGRSEDLRLCGFRPIPAPGPAERTPTERPEGSVVCVLATDAPLDSRQLGRICRRVQNGLARTGGDTEHGSGEFVISFSTTHRGTTPHGGTTPSALTADSSSLLNPLFRATGDAVEEAVVNSLVASTTVTGVDGHVVQALPHTEILGWTRRQAPSRG